MAEGEQDRDGSRPEAAGADWEDGQSSSRPRPTAEDAVTPADQAIINQEQALESGEENAV